MTDQQSEERIALEDIPLTLAVEYVNPEDQSKPVLLRIAGKDPFIHFEMKQAEGMVVAEITASCIPDDQDLIETLEVFLAALVEERASRLSAEALRAAAEDARSRPRARRGGARRHDRASRPRQGRGSSRR